MTQRIKSDEWQWQMYDDDHQLTSSPDYGSAELHVSRNNSGEFYFFATETGKRAKFISIHLKGDAVRSLREFLNGAEE
jgi:hypothetical protein